MHRCGCPELPPRAAALLEEEEALLQQPELYEGEGAPVPVEWDDLPPKPAGGCR